MYTFSMGLKAEQQRIRIIESASYCLTHFGERGTTFQAIADHCKLSQASIVKYLKSRDNIFPAILEYWVARARARTESAVLSNQTPEQKLKAYLKISQDLFYEKHEISITMLTLHYFAGVEEKYRIFNSAIKDVAQKRIAAIIEEGVSDGSFKKVNSKIVAKTIHNCLMGYLLSSVTETSDPIQLQLPGMLEEICMGLLRGPNETTKS